MSKQKSVIRLGVPNDKNRSKAMQMASKFVGVNSVGIAGDAKDRLEVVGESVDITCMINLLRKKVCRADIVVVEEVKDGGGGEEEEGGGREKEEGGGGSQEEEGGGRAQEEALSVPVPAAAVLRCLLPRAVAADVSVRAGTASGMPHHVTMK
uniref:HMA domain-containing protein n=1 Tax=Zea mays TaxID=4577 RepID=A0A804RIS2_MAIZE